jgi:hypothetical protein
MTFIQLFKKWSWKLFGALFMRNKGLDGQENQAISNHKFFGMICFLFAAYIWMFGGIDVSYEDSIKLLEAGRELPSKWGNVPDVLIYSVWAFLGVDIAKSMIEVIKNLKQ